MSKMLKKISVVGHFAEGKNLLNGQTIKTKILTESLENVYGSDAVMKIDTHGGIKTLVKAPYHVLTSLKGAKNVIMLPAHNGLRVYAPLLAIAKKLFRGRKIHYAVIGGWLPEFLKKRAWLKRFLMSFDGIYVETNTMKNALEAMGFKNIVLLPNCKKLNILKEDELVYYTEPPLPLCTFSRVMKEKGIEDAIEAVKRVNASYGKTVYTLDIYGQVDASQTEWFEELKTAFPDYVSYGGLVPFDKSTEVLKSYYALLFPTRFFTEGIPGTVIDAYAAGVPVISSAWQSFADVIEDGYNGIGYDFASVDALEKTLDEFANNPEKLNSLKTNCIASAEKFLPEVAVKILEEHFM